MIKFTDLKPLEKGAKVAVISPSAGLPGLFPWVYEQGLERLREHFGFEIVEYPTTRQFGSSLRDRARDINAAFADQTIQAIFTAIGGIDQIQLLKYLDVDNIRDNPKMFFGYSDNTQLHQLLWTLGLPSCYGGAIMTQFGMNGAMEQMTIDSIKNACMRRQGVVITPSDYVMEKELDWAEASNLDKHRQREPNDGYKWDINETKAVSGRLWGGCADCLIVRLASNIFLPSPDDLDGAVLFFETSEDIPDHWITEYFLIGLGERGILERINAVLVGRPKTWSLGKQLTDDERVAYREQQAEIVIKTVREYNKTAPIVQNLDFGHTDPQIIVPMGNLAHIDPKNRTIKFDY